MYMDERCVENNKPLLESGTMGTKGHVQVILPEKTETYSDQNDPNEDQVPFCTIKSFPGNINHCIQWARDKFESLFVIKPRQLKKFLDDKEEYLSVSYPIILILDFKHYARSIDVILKICS